MDQDIEREAKQNYLKTNILEKGYDANKFIAFLVDIKSTKSFIGCR